MNYHINYWRLKQKEIKKEKVVNIIKIAIAFIVLTLALAIGGMTYPY